MPEHTHYIASIKHPEQIVGQNSPSIRVLAWASGNFFDAKVLIIPKPQDKTGRGLRPCVAWAGEWATQGSGAGALVASPLRRGTVACG